MWNLKLQLRQRVRHWPSSLAFIAVIGSAIAVAGALLAVAFPILSGALPFPEPHRLLSLETSKQGQSNGLTWMNLEDVRNEAIQSAAVFSPRTWGVQTQPQGHVEVVLSLQVTGEFFDVIGVNPALGQPLTTAHDQIGNQNWVWLSHNSWQHLLGGTQSFGDRTLTINAVPYRVAGIMPPSFDFPYRGQSPDIYIPLNRADYWHARGAGGLGAIVKLKPAVSPQQFQSAMDARSAALASQFPATHRDLHFTSSSLTVSLLGDRLPLLRWLTIAALILLLVAMANASGIWLAQWTRQQRQAGIQMCLGASARQVLTWQMGQLAVLGAASSIAGIASASILLNFIRTSALLNPELSRFELWSKASLDWQTGLTLAACAVLASLVSGLPPLTMSKPTANLHISNARKSRTLRTALAMVQLTLTGTLTYSGIAIYRNVQTLLQADRGFRTEQILVSGIGIPEAKYNTDEKMIQFHQRAIDELARIPGVTAAAGGVSFPINNARTRFLIDGETTPKEQQKMARIGVANPDLLAMLGIPLLNGRMFDSNDRWGTPRVALVNQAFAQRYLSESSDPLGHKLRVSFYNGFAMKPYEQHVIVGIIANTLNRELALQPEPQIIITSNQIAMEGFQYFIRSALPADNLKKEVSQAIWNVDPEIQRIGLQPLSTRLENSLAARRSIAWLLTLFGGLAVLIVTFGLASSLFATFAEMTRELGIKAALGASPPRLSFDAIRWGLFSITSSCLLSFPISMALGKLIVFDGTPIGWDPTSWIFATTALGLIGLLSAWIPARRAALADPAAALRTD